MPTASRIDLCNKAVSLIKAKAMQSLDENSLEARECNRHYPDVIAEMLEGPHDWSFANRRVALAAMVTNDRENEWGYAYAVPSDMGSPIRVLPDLTSAGVGLPVPLAGDPYAEAWSGYWSQYETPYIIQNGVIYSNTESATLEYGINAIEEVSLSPLVQRAIYTDLASRIAKPVKDDVSLAGELAKMTELLWQRAIADDMNRQPQSSGNYLSESMAARAGYG